MKRKKSGVQVPAERLDQGAQEVQRQRDSQVVRVSTLDTTDTYCLLPAIYLHMVRENHVCTAAVLAYLRF